MCSKEGVGYKVWCPLCEEEGSSAVMHGETGRCARVRIGEHFNALEQGRSSNLREHCEEFHHVDFKCKVTRVFRDPLTRQLEEAMCMRIAGDSGILMNDKDEWVRPAGVTVVAQEM